MPVRKPDREITRWTNQKNSGRSRGVTLIAVHESVGITNAWDLALFCERRGVSYHDMVDLTQLVHAAQFSDTAWHLRNGNPSAVGLCLTSPVRAYSRGEWLGPQLPKVEYAAWWVARACAIYGLPLRHCNYGQIRSALRGNKSDGGVITHDDYTQATGDGTHTDPRNFPMDVCLDIARGSVSPESKIEVPKVRINGDEAVTEIRLERNGKDFRGFRMAEVGESSSVVAEAFVTHGSAFGSTDFKITALKRDGTIIPPHICKCENNHGDYYTLESGTYMVTVEGTVSGNDTMPAAELVVKLKQ